MAAKSKKPTPPAPRRSVANQPSRTRSERSRAFRKKLWIAIGALLAFAAVLIVIQLLIDPSELENLFSF